MSHSDLDLAKDLTMFLRNHFLGGVDHRRGGGSIEYILSRKEFWQYWHHDVARILWMYNWHAQREQQRFDVWWRTDDQKPDGYDYHIRLAEGQEFNRRATRSHPRHH